MPNSTLVAVPTKFSDFKQVRAFAIKLIEHLDIVLGYRGNAGYEVAGTSSEANTTTLTSLAQSNLLLSAEIDQLRLGDQALQQAILTVAASINNSAYETGVTITNLGYSTQAMPASYSQASIQTLANSVKAIADKVDETLDALRSIDTIG